MITIDDHPAIEELRAKVDEVENFVNYSLSDAIREGSSVTEQMYGGWYDSTQACALSAALIAVKARWGA